MTNLPNLFAAAAAKYRYKTALTPGNETISSREAVFFLPSLPHGPTGKTQRQLLKQLLLELMGEANGR